MIKYAGIVLWGCRRGEIGAGGALVADDGTRKGFPSSITPKDLAAAQAQFMIDTAPPAAPAIDLSSIVALQKQLDALQTEVTKMQPIVPVPPLT